jgi:radical SAM protein with 4Fe4S-binding SPASM domain
MNSSIFNNLRDLNLYEGKCGRCEFTRVCGGCRARAYEITGNYLAEEPYCIYEPKAGRDK